MERGVGWGVAGLGWLMRRPDPARPLPQHAPSQPLSTQHLSPASNCPTAPTGCPNRQIIDAVLENPDDKTEVSLIFANESDSDIILKVGGWVAWVGGWVGGAPGVVVVVGGVGKDKGGRWWLRWWPYACGGPG